VGGFFEDMKEILAGEGFGLGRSFHKPVDNIADILYMSKIKYTIYRFLGTELSPG
jgi:hypothetical protein